MSKENFKGFSESLLKGTEQITRNLGFLEIKYIEMRVNRVLHRTVYVDGSALIHSVKTAYKHRGHKARNQGCTQ